MFVKKIFLILSLFLLILPNIYAMGVGIWVEEVNFEPNLNQNFNAFINNNMPYDARIKLIARGDLAEYITFSDEYLDIPAGGRGYFNFNLKLPESIPPGRNRIDIGGEDVTHLLSGGISSKTAAYIGFFVRAPYPGKYIEAGFSANDIEENGIANFNVNIISRGSETINQISGIIEIFNQDTKIAALTLNPITNINPGESKTIGAEWDSRGQRIGEYAAKAIINYDAQQLTLDTNFKIGALLVKITNYTREFYKDEINKFDIEIESFWNMQIDNVYGEIEVDNQKINTLEANLAPWGKTTITSYLDTAYLDLGEHNANIKVYYADKVAEEVAKIIVLPKRERVVELPFKTTPITILLVAVIILLVIGNIVLILHFLRYGKNLKKLQKKVKKK